MEKRKRKKVLYSMINHIVTGPEPLSIGTDFIKEGDSLEYFEGKHKAFILAASTLDCDK